MTTALFLILPAAGIVILGVIAMSAIRRNASELEPISSVWPTVLDALPPAELEHHEPGPARKAA